MNIGIFTDTYKPNINGVVTSIDIKKKELEKMGHKVYIIAPEEPGHTDDEPDIIRMKSFTLIFQPEYRLSFPPGIKGFNEIDRLKLNIIHAETPFSLGLLAAYIAKKDKIPLIHTYHTLFPEYVHYLKLPTTFTRKMAENLSAMYCNMCDHIISPSTDVKDELERYGVTKPITIIPTGIDIKCFDNIDGSEVRKQFGIDNETKVLIFVGRLGKEKNIDFLMDAFEDIKSKYSGKLKFMLVGDGPYREELVKITKEKGISDDVVFAGYIKRDFIAPYFAAADVFIFASVTETQGLVVLEAMASGCPVVAVKASGVEDMVRDGYSGFLTKHDVQDFNGQLKLILENDSLRSVISNNAKIHSKEFTPEKTFKKMVDIYAMLYEYSNRIKLRKALKIRKSKTRAIIVKMTRRGKKNRNTQDF